MFFFIVSRRLRIEEKYDKMKDYRVFNTAKAPL